eukprot:3181051-Amphidinium_carterae.1
MAAVCPTEAPLKLCSRRPGYASRGLKNLKRRTNHKFPPKIEVRTVIYVNRGVVSQKCRDSTISQSAMRTLSMLMTMIRVNNVSDTVG